jgi:hypothetical protein
MWHRHKFNCLSLIMSIKGWTTHPCCFHVMKTYCRISDTIPYHSYHRQNIANDRRPVWFDEPILTGKFIHMFSGVIDTIIAAISVLVLVTIATIFEEFVDMIKEETYVDESTGDSRCGLRSRINGRQIHCLKYCTMSTKSSLVSSQKFLHYDK